MFSEEENTVHKKYCCKECCSPSKDIATYFTFTYVYLVHLIYDCYRDIMIQQWPLPGKKTGKDSG